MLVRGLCLVQSWAYLTMNRCFLTWLRQPHHQRRPRLSEQSTAQQEVRMRVVKAPKGSFSEQAAESLPLLWGPVHTGIAVAVVAVAVAVGRQTVEERRTLGNRFGGRPLGSCGPLVERGTYPLPAT